MYKCAWCDEHRYDKLLSLKIHAKHAHGKTSQEVYDYLFCDNGRPTCACGCGAETRFLSIGRGYNKYVDCGHVSRVNNGWGHNPKALQNSIKTRRLMYHNGEIKGWMSGKCKKTDARIAAAGKKISETLRSDIKHSNRASENMKKLWVKGKISPNKAENHPAWKGGYSSLAEIVHSRLYNSWSLPKMIDAGFSCEICGSSHNICVHHDKERFSDIVKRVAQKNSYDHSLHKDDFDKKTQIADEVLEIHKEVSGIVLCVDCHAREHELCGEYRISKFIKGSRR